MANQVVWITGASSGIGAALAKQYAASGAYVVASARGEDKLKELIAQLPFPERHYCLPLDLEHSEDFSKLADSVIQRYGKLDVLINNGGLSQRSEASQTDLAVDRKIMEINYFGNIALTKAVLPHFQRQQHGKILVISSIAGKFGFYLRSAYSASKHALHGFYESLRLEEAKNQIQVTIACPGKINTPISEHALTADGSKHGQMDHNQATGMSAEECARQLISALDKGKREVLIGNKEIKAVTLKRFFPALFWKVIARQSPT